jgi:hypothetical protein
MKEATKPRSRRCPICKRQYPEEDNYCGVDGSSLEPPQSNETAKTERISTLEASASRNSEDITRDLVDGLP